MSAPYSNVSGSQIESEIYLEGMVEVFDEGIETRNLAKCNLVIKDLRDKGFEQAADKLQTELSNKRLHEN